MDVTARQIAAANVRREMQARGWTQAELARRANLHQPRISQILSGEKDVRLGTLEKVANAFGIAVSALLMPIITSEASEVSPESVRISA